jgi:hypothetical protein
VWPRDEPSALMLHEKITQWLRRMLPPDTDNSPHTDMGVIDRRLLSVEREQADIEFRLRVLERRGDPRGILEGRYSD